MTFRRIAGSWDSTSRWSTETNDWSSIIDSPTSAGVSSVQCCGGGLAFVNRIGELGHVEDPGQEDRPVL